MRFYGNQHAHFAMVNETDVTRVSLDLRVVPAPLFQPAWASPQGDVHFRLGGYYKCTWDVGELENPFRHVKRTDGCDMMTRR